VAVTFGGTVVGNGKDWISNLRWFIPFHEDEYTETVQLFNPAFAEEFVRIRTKMREPESVALYSTGHSLGGGLAQQFAYSLPLGPNVPRVGKVYAFDPSPVTGYFSVNSKIRRTNGTGLLIDRIYERGEILAYVRSITNFVRTPSAKNPEIRQIRYNLFYTVNPFKGHSISELAAQLWDLVYAPAAAAPRAVWRRPKMW
jgi:pimeloyl-ACP methyl ester carboxylesterase